MEGTPKPAEESFTVVHFFGGLHPILRSVVAEAAGLDLGECFLAEQLSAGASCADIASGASRAPEVAERLAKRVADKLWATIDTDERLWARYAQAYPYPEWRDLPSAIGALSVPASVRAFLRAHYVDGMNFSAAVHHVNISQSLASKHSNPPPEQLRRFLPPDTWQAVHIVDSRGVSGYVSKYRIDRLRTQGGLSADAGLDVEEIVTALRETFAGVEREEASGIIRSQRIGDDLSSGQAVEVAIIMLLDGMDRRRATLKAEYKFANLAGLPKLLRQIYRHIADTSTSTERDGTDSAEPEPD